MSDDSFLFVQNAVELEAALADLGDRVAVDTEFHAEHHYFPQLKLVQVRGEKGPALLIDPLAIRDLAPLGEALSRRTLLMHAPSQDLVLLVQRCGLRPGAVADTQVFAGFAGLGYPTSLHTICARLLGVDLERGSTLSNWQQRPLTEAQKRYAASDVRWLHAIVDELTWRLPPERLAQATAATAELVAASLAPPDPDALWRDLPGAAILDAPGRAALRQLAAWRDREARRQDQPRWQVAPDAALIDLARRRPKDAEILSENRKLPKRLGRDFAEEVLRALESARAEPEDRWPGEVAVRRGAAMLDHILAAWAHGVEVEEGVAASLVLPDPLRRAIVLREVDDRWPMPPLGWRETRYGPQLAALIRGDMAVRMPSKGG